MKSSCGVFHNRVHCDPGIGEVPVHQRGGLHFECGMSTSTHLLAGDFKRDMYKEIRP